MQCVVAPFAQNFARIFHSAVWQSTPIAGGTIFSFFQTSNGSLDFSSDVAESISVSCAMHVCFSQNAVFRLSHKELFAFVHITVGI
jgi:hypothetical protein